jgi:hypothetical protein
MYGIRAEAIRGFRHEVINLLRAEPFTPGPNSYDPVPAASASRFNLGQQARPKATRPGWIGGWR